MPGEKAKAACLVAQQHGRQIAVSNAHLALIGHGARDAKGLKAKADLLGGLRRRFAAGLERNGTAQRVGPDRVVKGDGLHPAHELRTVDPVVEADRLTLLQGGKAILGKRLLQRSLAAVKSFKSHHGAHSFLGSITRTASSKRP